MSRYDRWQNRIEAIQQAGRFRQVFSVDPLSATEAVFRGQQVIVACSNDYLGIAYRAPAVGRRGAGSSRLIGGSRPLHHALEAELEDWYGRPALVFGSGYQANLAVFSTICGSGETIASDESNHASMIDGMRLSRANRVIVPHCAPDQIPKGATAVAVEGLFSMDGDIPPLTRYPAGPWLAVDEAHAVGALGPDGRGASANQGITPDIIVGTFGKALGAFGAFVIGPPELKTLLANEARSFIFTTALPENTIANCIDGIRTVRTQPELQSTLHENTRMFRSFLNQLGWSPLGDAHIVPVVVGPSVMKLSERLLTRGILAPGIRWPTVAVGSERIRFTVSAAHTAEQLQRIADALGTRTSWEQENAD